MAILTLAQFADADHRRVVAEYGVTLTEVQGLYPVEAYRPRWWQYVTDAFNDGDDFTPQAIGRLTAPQLRDLSRTTRGLRQGLPRVYLLRGNTLALRGQLQAA